MSGCPTVYINYNLAWHPKFCRLIMMERSSAKGNGLHLDIVLLALINFAGSIFGGPWIWDAIQCCHEIHVGDVMSQNSVLCRMYRFPHPIIHRDFFSQVLGSSPACGPLLQLATSQAGQGNSQNKTWQNLTNNGMGNSVHISLFQLVFKRCLFLESRHCSGSIVRHGRARKCHRFHRAVLRSGRDHNFDEETESQDPTVQVLDCARLERLGLHYRRLFRDKVW